MITLDTPKLTAFTTNRSTGVARIPSKRFGFTKKLLDKLPSPKNAQRSYVYDTQTRGLALAVSPSGKKTFLLYRKVQGRPERINIGPYPDLSIEQARDRAAELNGKIARGENPAEKRRTVRDEMTLAELFQTYLDQHAKPHKRRWQDDVGIFNLHLADWKLRKISDVRRIDILTLHAKIGAKAPYTANRVVELLSSMFNKCIEWGWAGLNPATKIKAFKEKKRERFLQPQEFPDFIRALGAEPNEAFRDFFFLCLFSGARRANVQGMRWDEIDFKTATWTIPEETSKSGESVAVALSAPAMAILANRKASSESEWVFPGPGKTGHIMEPKTAWKRILERAGISDLRIHDLRRTLGSWQAATGASLPIIGKSLGHRSLSATAVYARLNLDPVRLSVEKATDAMLLAATGPVRLLTNE